MAGQTTGLQKSYKIMDPDGVGLYRIVTYGANDNECIKPVTDNVVPIGVVCNDERINDPLRAGGNQVGRQVAVQLTQIASVELAEAVEYGAPVMVGQSGFGKAVPSTPGSYHCIGFAEKTGGAGEVIPVRLAYHIVTVA